MAVAIPTPPLPDGYNPSADPLLAITAADVIRWDARALRVVRAVDRARNAAVVAETTSSSLVGGSLSKGNLAISGIVALGTNLYDYGFGEHRDQGVGSQEFWVSTGVDLGTSVGVGVGSTMALVGLSGALVLLGGAAIAAPELILGAAALGLVASIALEISGAGSEWKEDVNNFVDEREEEFEMLENAPDQAVAPKSGLPIR